MACFQKILLPNGDVIEFQNEAELQQYVKENYTLLEQIATQELSEELNYGEWTPELVSEMVMSRIDIEGLTPVEEFTIVNSIFIDLSNMLKSGEQIDKASALAKARQNVLNFLFEKRKHNIEQLESWKEIETDGIKKEKQKRLEENKKIDIVINNINTLVDNGFARLQKYVKTAEVFEEDEMHQIEKAYNASSLEDNGKKHGSYFLKRFYSGIQDRLPNGDLKTGFLGFPVYIGFDRIEDLMKTLLTTPLESEANFAEMISILEQNSEQQTWLPDFIDKLKKADGQIQNAFVSENRKHNLSSKFAMFQENKDGTYSLKIYDTNSNEIKRVIRNEWVENSLNLHEGIIYWNKATLDYKINVTKAKTLWNKWKHLEANNWKKQYTPSKDEIKLFLREFGIDVSDATLDHFIKQPGYALVGDKYVAKSYKSLFELGKSGGLYGSLLSYLQQMAQKDSDVTILEDNKNHPFYDINNHLNAFINVEQKYTKHTTTISFRDGGKSIYAKPLPCFATDMANKLVKDESFRTLMSSKVFNGKSVLLNLINTNDRFKDFFGIDYLANTALKEFGSKFTANSEITSLSSIDREIVKLAGLLDMKQGSINLNLEGQPLLQGRLGRMFFPTMSDKSQMFFLRTLLIDMQRDLLNEDKTELRNDVLELLYSQLVEAELERIIEFSKREKTNISDYDSVAGLFLMLPGLNEIMIGDVTVAQYLNVNKNYNANIQNFLNNTIDGVPIIEVFKTKAKKYINSLVLDKVQTKKMQYEDLFYSVDENGNEKVIILDKEYLASRKNVKDKKEAIEMVAFDMVINNLLTMANISMLFFGDLAFYAQEKQLKNFFNDGDVSSPKVENAYAKFAESAGLDINLGKRLAFLAAPRKKLNNSNIDSYYQIFLSDFKDITNNFADIVKIHYGKEAAKEAQQIINEYNASTSNVVRKELLSTLASKYPSISDFLNLTATDAQEYTTVREHVELLYREGYMEEKMFNQIIEKLDKRKGKKEISKEDFLSFEELKIVLTPIKPVYTGMINDTENGVMRPMYIKSSSFPLLPELTLDMELDNLRVAMEELENTTGKRVRASYQTANKIGSLKNALSIFDSNGQVLPLTADNLLASSLLLDRDNFGIQQDVPPKFLKGEEKVALGTQLLKLSFGNGIVDLPGFKEMQQKFNANFVELINIKKQNLFRDLGLSPIGQIENIAYTLEKLQEVLLDEAKKRNYPMQSVEALNAVALVGVTLGDTSITGANKSITLNSKEIKFLEDLHAGKVPASIENISKMQKLLNSNISQEDFLSKELKFNFKDVNFSLPLWMTPDSNKFESLLNSMFSKRLIELKLPGNAFVVGSEAGLKLKAKSKYEGKVIFTSKYQGELKARTESNKVQVFLPLRLRDNKGKLISFFDAQGNPNTKYVNVREDGYLTLKEDMIDEELLSSISFRIPTSGLISASAIEIVGILPVEVGDLMIVPKALTAQKGLDFDVDKENMYYLHHYVNAEGKIKVLTDPELTLEEEQEFIETYKELKKQYTDKKFKQDLLKNLQDEAEAMAAMGFDVFKETIKKGKKLQKELKENTLKDIDFFTYEIAYRNLMDKNFRTKILENEIVKTHQEILYSNNPEVLKKVNRVLSMDNAKNNKKLVQDALNSKKDYKYFTSFDGDHQDNKMELGAAGKLGISIYSNAVTFNGLAEQLDKPVQLFTFIVNERGKTERVPYNTTIGNFTSKGTLGQITTFDGQRTIPEILEERQNTATDNEKEQIMGVLNVNDLTIGVDVLMTLLGFDSETFKIDDKEISVNLAYMLLSQPIIREYVTLMKAGKSKMNEFSSNKEKEVIDYLLGRFGDMAKSAPDDSLLTGFNMYTELLAKEPTPAVQYAALTKFLELKNMYNSLSKSISRFNINSSKLGISFFDVIEKYDYIANSLGNESYADNLIDMLGEVVADFLIEEFTPEMEKMFLEQGLLPFYGEDKVRIFKATTPIGAILLNSIHSAYNTWNSFFPYDSQSLRSIISQIKLSLANQELSESKDVEIRQKVFQEFKKYLVTRQSFNIVTNPVAERYRLMIDTVEEGGKQKNSLATYLRNLKNLKPNLFLNPLIMNLEFKSNMQGFAKISFNNTKQEDFDESSLYNAFIELLSSPEPLPKFNGEEYSTVTLVQDLIKYAYLEGGVQEATQFVKYIPVTILDKIGFGAASINTQKGLDNSDVSKAESIQLFIKQFFQNNPQMAAALPTNIGKLNSMINIIDGNLKTLDNLKSFEIKNGGAETFVRIYNPFIPKGFKKYQLYQRDSQGIYHRIGLLGYDTISEYSFGIDNKSLIEKNRLTVNKPAMPQVTAAQTSGTQTLPFGMEKVTGLINIVENILSSDLSNTSIKESEITYTDEEGNPCAKRGMRSSNFTKGSKWEIVKDLKGYPSHAQGGVDIKLGKDGFSFARGGGYIKAAHGLVLPKIK
jgi:hypothetical protein